jgi:hypothetical protein
MSCLFQLFKKKPVPKETRKQDYIFSIPLFGPAPSTLEELRILEYEIGRKMSYLNGKSKKLYSNASHCQAKGDIRKASMYIRHRKSVVDDISKLSD